MPRHVILTGKRFGDLEVLGEFRLGGRWKVNVRCQCGKPRVFFSHEVSGGTRTSCGFCQPTQQDASLLWACVRRQERSHCWPYQAELVHASAMPAEWKQAILAGRGHWLAFKLVHGSVSAHTDRKCNNPTCCNPAHLVSFDSREELLAWRRRRSGMHVKTKVRHRWHAGHRNHRCGLEHPRAVLTIEQVWAIRRLHAQGLSQRDIAKRVGCSRCTARCVVNKISYTDVPGLGPAVA